MPIADGTCSAARSGSGVVHRRENLSATGKTSSEFCRQRNIQLPFGDCLCVVAFLLYHSARRTQENPKAFPSIFSPSCNSLKTFQSRVWSHYLTEDNSPRLLSFVGIIALAGGKNHPLVVVGDTQSSAGTV